MQSLLSTIFGDITYDDQANAYFWHPWLEEDNARDAGGGGPNSDSSHAENE